MRELLRRYDLVGVVETHVDPETAELFFFDKMQRNDAAPGEQGGTVEYEFYYEWGMAVGFKKRWAKEHKASKIQVVKEQGVCFGVQWEIGDGRRGFFLVFHLDAAEESTRIAQLEEMGEWVRNNVRGGDLLLFGGDRNFTMREDERMSSRRSTWRPSAKMNEAWSRWEMNTAAFIQKIKS